MLEMAVLGLLKDQDMHGYELKKRITDVCGLSGAVSFGSLYPALARLERAGGVRVVSQAGAGAGGWAAGEARPPEAASGIEVPGPGTNRRLASRRRKIYGITPLGVRRFEELLTGREGSVEDERSFNLRLAFARHLPAEARIGMLERRRSVLRERLAHMTRDARPRRDDRYLRILGERQQEALERELSWLDGLVRDERLAGYRMGLPVFSPPAPVVPAPVVPPPAPPPAPVVPAPAEPAPPEPSSPGPPAAAAWRARSRGPGYRLVPLVSASQLQRGPLGEATPGAV